MGICVYIYLLLGGKKYYRIQLLPEQTVLARVNTALVITPPS